MKISGIDVGGSGIKGAILDPRKGKLLSDWYRVPTPKPATRNYFCRSLWNGNWNSTFHNQQLAPNTELRHIPMHGMAAEDYAANSVCEKNNLSWEEWAGRVDEYLQLIDVYFLARYHHSWGWSE